MPPSYPASHAARSKDTGQADTQCGLILQTTDALSSARNPSASDVAPLPIQAQAVRRRDRANPYLCIKLFQTLNKSDATLERSTKESHCAVIMKESVAGKTLLLARSPTAFKCQPVKWLLYLSLGSGILEGPHEHSSPEPGP
ncbi:hypothetical protein P7K49_003905 [Saguinus oedipus]|uniref:Uncharacterized protein n=1 Tax=Saguinus oedipus TaxID=9490 RepID=A0ABQ9W5V9_SAGOE|nr:hypothetical protein P7K49_003905 [Saguinus oedipus]